MSLQRRLVLAASLVLVAFFGLTGAALDRAFRDSGRELVRDQLLTRVYALLTAAESADGGPLALPADLPDPGLATPASGVFAEVHDSNGNTIWRSRSSLGTRIEYPPADAPGTVSFGSASTATGDPVFALSFAVRWEIAPGDQRDYLFAVAQSHAPFAARVARFRHSLWGWLAGAALLLLAVQGAILRWGLAPLARLAGQVDAIEAGERDRVSTSWPRELGALARSLNALIDTGRGLIERQRDALGDLAHSLKTPLAVLRAEAGRGDPAVIEQQVAQMDRCVEYHLRRASTAGSGVLARAVAPAALAMRLRDALLKVHADKRLVIEVDIAADCRFFGDEGDLLEILGNLLDNACKWAQGRVRVSGATLGPARREASVELVVEDDGPGIEADAATRLLERGARADPTRPGHGLGLALVHELVTTVYRGDLVIERSTLGGARVRVRLHPPV